MALLALASLPGGCGPRPAPSDRTGTLTLLAAASLAAPFQDLADTLRALMPGLDVRLGFAGSHQLALQVEHGGRADLAAVADPVWITRLADRGQVAGAPLIFASNRLVVAIPDGNPGRIGALADLARPGIRLVLGAPASPIGHYTREVIGRLSRAADLPGDFGRNVLANVVSEEQDVTAIVAKVRLGEADAGFVYRSDVASGSGLAAIEIPDSLNASARYAAAALRTGPSPDAARAFLKLLASPAGQALLRRHGFEPP